MENIDKEREEAKQLQKDVKAIIRENTLKHLEK